MTGRSDEQILKEGLRRVLYVLPIIVMIVVIWATAIRAATPKPIYWPPAQMAALLIGNSYAGPNTAGTCKGATVAHAGTYFVFRCQMGATSTRSSIVFAKTMPRGYACVSPTMNFRGCKVVGGVLAFDPTVCFIQDPQRCGIGAAVLALRKNLGHGEPGGLYQGEISCLLSGAFAPRGPLAYGCTTRNGTGTGTYNVVFRRGSTAWAITITTS